MSSEETTSIASLIEMLRVIALTAPFLDEHEIEPGDPHRLVEDLREAAGDVTKALSGLVEKLEARA